MKGVNINEIVSRYLKVKPGLTHEQMGTLLTLDAIYSKVPTKINTFRQIYPYFDPDSMSKGGSGITFLQIAKSKEPTSVIKHRLNAYINIKYNYFENFLPYEKNMKKFRDHSLYVSRFLDDILKLANYPEKIFEALREKEAVRKCYDFYELLNLYQRSKTKRLRFEILRKIGLIVMLSRISRTFVVDEIDHMLGHVKNVFHKGLGMAKKTKCHMYLWVDEKNKVHYTHKKRLAKQQYTKAKEKREFLAMPVYSLQTFEYNPYKTKFGSEILHMEMRNKLRPNGDISYTSVIEKMLRKNLQFPNQVHDIIGVKLVVNTEAEIPQLIKDLETFLGGSSTRKREKNTFNNFGKKKLGKFSSTNYFVWKAVYDVAIPPPIVHLIGKTMAMNRNNRIMMDSLKNMLDHYKDRPKDVIVEVQLQDLDSYLMNIARGNPAEHSVLKMKQVRMDTFYKIYPKEIYSNSLSILRNKLLK